MEKDKGQKKESTIIKSKIESSLIHQQLTQEIKTPMLEEIYEGHALIREIQEDGLEKRFLGLKRGRYIEDVEKRRLYEISDPEAYFYTPISIFSMNPITLFKKKVWVPCLQFTYKSTKPLKVGTLRADYMTGAEWHKALDDGIKYLTNYELSQKGSGQMVTYVMMAFAILIGLGILVMLMG